MSVGKLIPIPAPGVSATDQQRNFTTDWYRWLLWVRDQLTPPPVTVAGLPAASSVTAGSRRFVTDASATTFHSTVAGGGANKVPVVSDGTNWLIG